MCRLWMQSIPVLFSGNMGPYLLCVDDFPVASCDCDFLLFPIMAAPTPHTSLNSQKIVRRSAPAEHATWCVAQSQTAPPKDCTALRSTAVNCRPRGDNGGPQLPDLIPNRM